MRRGCYRYYYRLPIALVKCPDVIDAYVTQITTLDNLTIAAMGMACRVNGHVVAAIGMACHTVWEDRDSMSTLRHRHRHRQCARWPSGDLRSTSLVPYIDTYLTYFTLIKARTATGEIAASPIR